VKDRTFFVCIGVVAGAILGWLPLPLALKIGTYIGLAAVLTGFLFLMQWFDRKLVELQK
jgi:uncharacterized membrane protein HdeD (DUF308 family)